MKARNFIALIICLALPLAVGSLSALATAKDLAEWYPELIKPSFNPPNSVFGPVWTVLYLLMGVSFYMVWNTSSGELRTKAFLVFGVQLFLNFWWSVFFFSFQRPDVALAEICLLWLAVLYMIFTFKGVKPLAAYLQIPYLLWISFATVLNEAIWTLNK
jgi:tryptophan-rich sensory protein